MIKKLLTIVKQLCHKIIDCKYYPSYLLRKRLNISEGSVLIVVHDLKKQGSQTLAYHIVKKYVDDNIGVCVFGYAFGPMMQKFMNLAPLYVGSKRKLLRISNRIRKEKKCSKVICNTVVTGDAVKELQEQGYVVVSLVHELKQLIIENQYVENCKNIADNANTVVFPSQRGYRDFCECVPGKVFNYKIKNQGLFLTKDYPQDKKSSKRVIYAKYGLPVDAKIIINVATANLRKGIDLFLDIAYKVGQQDGNIYFIWVGDGTEKYVDSKTKESKWCNLILPGYIQDVEFLNHIYNAADLLLLTSREEPFGSIVLEAFQAGTPVMAFENCGGYMDVVRDNDTGFLVQPYDTDAMVEKILGVVYDCEMLKRISLACKDEVKKHDFSAYCHFIYDLF